MSNSVVRMLLPQIAVCRLLNCPIVIQTNYVFMLEKDRFKAWMGGQVLLATIKDTNNIPSTHNRRPLEHPSHSPHLF